MPRLEPTPLTKKRLYALSGNKCAFPQCEEILITENGNKSDICHIEAASPEGERYNPKQTDEERRHFDNLILLCATHHRVTNNVEKYTVESLKRMKNEHERKLELNTIQNQYPVIEFSFDDGFHFKGEINELAISLDEAKFYLEKGSEDFVNIIFDIELWLKEDLHIYSKSFDIKQRQESLNLRRIMQKIEELREELKIALKVLLKSYFRLEINNDFEKLSRFFIEYTNKYVTTSQMIVEETNLLELLEEDYMKFKRDCTVNGIKFEAIWQHEGEQEIVVPFYLTEDEANAIYSKSYLGNTKISYKYLNITDIDVSDLPVGYVDRLVPRYLYEIYFRQKHNLLEIDKIEQFCNVSNYKIGLG